MQYDKNHGDFLTYESDDGQIFFGPRMARAIVIRGIEDKERSFWDLACSFQELEQNFPEAFNDATTYLRKWIEEIEQNRESQKRELREVFPRIINKKKGPKPREKKKSFKTLRKQPGSERPVVIEEERAC